MHRSADHARHRERMRCWRRLPAERAMLHARGLIRLHFAPARFAHFVVALELAHPDDPALPALGDHAKAARAVAALARLELAHRAGPTLEEGRDKVGAPVLAKLGFAGANRHGLLLRVRQGGVLGHLVLDLLESVAQPAVEAGLDVFADAIELRAAGALTLEPPEFDDDLGDQLGVLSQRCKEFAHLLECRCICLGHVSAFEVLDEADFFPAGLHVGRVRAHLLDWGCSGGGSRCGWVAAVLRSDRCSLGLCEVARPPMRRSRCGRHGWASVGRCAPSFAWAVPSPRGQSSQHRGSRSLPCT
mmetsp:Transcript_18475/g.50065  ORF Transcript_18475/g.50065 Transcript_18475/m.50065 type:complete len:302 (-) Transcript_18475:139-1044(-)